MIHFQARESGATLRMTELKPKLDRFLIAYHFKGKFDEYKQFLQGYHPEKEREAEAKAKGSYAKSIQHAFAYSANVVSKKGKFSLPKYYHGSLYFGNMGNKPENHKENIECVWTDEKLQLNFRSLTPELLTIISDNICNFFAVNNFGTRQNKGFGSFYLDPDDPAFVPGLAVLKRMKPQFIYWKYEKEYPSSKALLQTAFNDIYHVYILMKSGFNFPDHQRHSRSERGPNALYIKSHLFKYIDRQMSGTLGSEKKLIKESLFRYGLRKPKDNTQKRYIRAVLGLAGYFEYRDARWGTVHVNGGDIERFKSPITFKVIDKTVFAIPEDASPILGKTIALEEGGKSVPIQTPSTFDPGKFMVDFAQAFPNLADEIEEDWGARFDDPRGYLSKAVKELLDSLFKLELKIHQA